MKINSRKFLILSCALSGKPIEYRHLEYLWPDLSPGGRRSLIALLQQQRLISVRYEGKKALFFLSSIGISLVDEMYFTESLQESSQGFIVMIYPDMSLSDPKLVKLRALLKAQLSEVSPKVYFSRLPLTEELLSQMRRHYFSCGVVVSLREWLLGEPISFENYYLHRKISDDSLSGVSREVEQLIDEKILFSDANHQSNMRIFSLFDRIMTIFDSNAELKQYSIYNTSPATELLRRFSILF